MMAVRLAADFRATGHVTGLLLLASEALVVVLTMFRRSAGDRRSQHAGARADGVVDVRAAAGQAGGVGAGGAGDIHGDGLGGRAADRRRRER